MTLRKLATFAALCAMGAIIFLGIELVLHATCDAPNVYLCSF